MSSNPTKFSIPKIRSIQLLIFYPFWLAAILYGLTFLMSDSKKPYDVSDITFSAITILSIIVIIILSVFRNGHLSELLNTHFSPKDKSKFAIGVMIFYIFIALLAIFFCQLTLQKFKLDVDLKQKDGILDHFLVLDTLTFAMTSWTILLAYKLKIFWDHLVKIFSEFDR